MLQRPSDRPLTPAGGFAPPFAQQNPNAQSTAGTTDRFLPSRFSRSKGQALFHPSRCNPAESISREGFLRLRWCPRERRAVSRAQEQNPGQNPGQNLGQPGQLRPPQLVPGQNPVSPFPGQPSPGGLPGGVQTGVPPGFRIDPSGQLVPAPPVPGQTPGQGIPGQPQGFPGQPFSPQPGAPQIQNQQTIQNPQFSISKSTIPEPTGRDPGLPNAALGLINQLLTSPRQTPSTPIATGSNQVGGIAGVASTYTGPSIKIYKDQDQYQLWEFVFSPTASTVPGAGTPGTGIPGNGQGRGGGSNQTGGQGGSNTFAPSGTFGGGGGQSTFGPRVVPAGSAGASTSGSATGCPSASSTRSGRYAPLAADQ